MKLNDIIARMQVPGQVINGYNVYNKKNIESSYIYGGEMALTYALNKYFTWSNNATYTYGQNITKKEPMRRIPPFFGQNKLAWNYQNKSIVITHEYAGKQIRLAQGDKDDNRIGILGTPAWSVFNIDAGWQLKHVYLQANLLNLFDKAYKTHGSGVYGIGRAVNLTIQWKIL
jgi:outer membrane receptor for ferrienterochelin and colicin